MAVAPKDVRTRRSPDLVDTNFQGDGRFLTGSTAESHLLTIKPVPYRVRPAAHIHARVGARHETVLDHTPRA